MEKIVFLWNFLRYKLKLESTGFFYINAFPTIKGGTGSIKVGANFYANRFLRIETIGADPKLKLVIGNNVSIGESVHIAASNLVTIKDYVLMGSRILITDHNHGMYFGTGSSSPEVPPQQREIFSAGEVIIEENVWIGDGVVILPGVKIGRGAIIGANSVVSCDIPEFTIAAGAPAKVFKKYNFHSNIWEKVKGNG